MGVEAGRMTALPRTGSARWLDQGTRFVRFGERAVKHGLTLLRVSRIFALACAIACAIATLSFVPPASAEGQLRVLITGDSITHGRHLDYTWRYRLDKEFVRQGRTVDFVGSKSTPYVDAGYATSRYADPNFDHDHFATAGATLSSMAPKIGAEVTSQQPDVVVMDGGTNDLLQGAQPAAIDASLRAWIAAVRDAKPDTRIILCRVYDLAGSRTAPDTNVRVAAYDALMQATAAELSTDASPITIAETDRGWNPDDHALSWDGIHLAPTGETLYAARVAEALEGAGLLGPSNLYRSVAWGRTSTTKATFAGRYATLTWDTQATSSALMRWHRIGSPWIQTGAIAGGRRVVQVVPGASYEFRVKLTRTYMSGPWGPITRVRAAATRPAAPARVTVTRSGVRWTRSAGASSYVVKFRKIHQHRWITRHTRAVSIRVPRVSVAKVQAVSAGGHSTWRQARR